MGYNPFLGKKSIALKHPEIQPFERNRAPSAGVTIDCRGLGITQADLENRNMRWLKAKKKAHK